MRITRQRILDRIGDPQLELWKGKGYYYFNWSEWGIYETRSVMVPRLSDLSLDQWFYEYCELMETVNETSERMSYVA